MTTAVAEHVPQNGAVQQAEATPSALAAPASHSTHRPHIAKALAEAAHRCQPVEKDARNAFHKYDYASAEAILIAAKDALHGSGLALVPLEQSLEGWERTGEARFELVRKWLLIHTSGEALPLATRWPVCPDKGRPLDKATAAADTLSLAYLLRDLLQMPRVDPADDVSGRDDRPHQAPPARPPIAPAAPPAVQSPASPRPLAQPKPPERISSAETDALCDLIHEADVSPEKFCQAYQIETVDDLPPARLEGARHKLALTIEKRRAEAAARQEEEIAF